MKPTHLASIVWRNVRQIWRECRSGALAREDVPITNCVHYCGFRYGAGRYNAYENYITGLADNVDVGLLRERFVSFLQYYRPRHFGEALRIELSTLYPMWHYPWDDWSMLPDPSYGWLSDPDEVPDILTHFSQIGIPSFRIEQEFYWLHRAYDRMKQQGYHPERYNSYAQTWKLESSRGNSVHLLLDGNHRASALHALGVDTIQAEVKLHVREDAVDHWAGVKRGLFTRSDALAIFQAYFRDNDPNYSTTDEPATILADWSLNPKIMVSYQ